MNTAAIVSASPPANIRLLLINTGALLSLYSARTVTVDSGNEFSGEARDAFDNVADISAVPDTVHTGLRRPSRSDGYGGKPQSLQARSGD